MASLKDYATGTVSHSTDALVHDRPYYPVKPRIDVKKPKMLMATNQPKPRVKEVEDPSPRLGARPIVTTVQNTRIYAAVKEDYLSTTVLVDDEIAIVDDDSDVGQQLLSAEGKPTLKPRAIKPRLQDKE